MYGLWFNLLGLNSSPGNPNTTSTSKSLKYIYIYGGAQCIQ